jgi:hypothetical protein
VEWSLRQTEHLEKRTISEWKEEMQTWGGQVDEVYVYRHPPSMRFAVRQKQDQRKISVKTLALIAHKHIRVESHISIANATLDNFTFSLLVSPALQIRQIQTKVGSPIRQTWFAGMQDQLRILRIELTQPMTQNQQIYLLAEQSIAQHKTDMPMIAPVHNRAWKGHLAIYTIGDLELETDNISHLKAIDLSPSQRISITREYRNYLPRLAYNFQRAYTGNVFLREVRSVRRCQLVLHSHLTRSRIHLRTTLNFHASGPGTQQFSFSLPDQLATHLEWIGYHSLNVKRSSETPGRTTFVFSSSHLLNNLQLAFRTHWPHTPEQTDVMPLIRPEDVQQSETLLALSASPDIRLMLDQIKLKELHTLPLDDFPIEDLDRRISTSSYIPAEEDSIIAAFRARQPKWQIILPQELLQTDIAIKPVVETAQLQTLLSYQGQAWTQAAYSVRTPGMQFLRVELPKQADLWQVTVDRQIIRPAKHENILLIPLPPRQISDLAYQVTLIYSHTLHLPKLFGSIQPLAPQLHNIDVSETFWQVFLPKEFAISDTDGNMEETVAIHIVYNRLKHELDFFHQLKGLSQTGKQSERTRATDNFKRQLRRMRRHLQQPSDYTKSPYRPPIAAPPAAPALMNRIQQRKSKEFEHKIQTLENTLRQLERSHESNQQPARPSRQQQFRQRRQYSPQQQGNYPQQQMHNYRQRRSYPQQQMRQNIDLNKGSFLFEPRQGLPLQDLSPRLAQPVPRTKKACSIKSSRSKNSSHALQPLTISMMGNQHTYVTIGGKPQLSLRIYRSDRFKIGIGWILWSIALLLAFYLWRRHTKYAA